MQINLLIGLLINLFFITSVFSEDIKCDYSNPAYNMCYTIKQCFFKMKVEKRSLYHNAFYEWGEGGSIGFSANDVNEPYYWKIKKVPESHKFMLEPNDWIYQIDECNPYVQSMLEFKMKYEQKKAHLPLIDILALFPKSVPHLIKTIEVGRLVDGKRVRMKFDIKELYRKKEIQDRHILRKIFFFWEWGDYF